MSKRIKLSPEEIANLNNDIIRARMRRMGPVILNDPSPVGSGSADGGIGAIAIGELFNDNFQRLSLGSDYTTAGVSTFNPTLTGLEISGGTTLTDYIVRNYYQSYEKVTISITYQVTSAASSSTLGLGFGWKDASSPDGESTIYGRLIHNNNSGNFGRVSINRWNGSVATQKAVSSETALSISNGDIFQITVTKTTSADVVRYSVTATKGASSNSITWDEGLSTTDITNGNLGDCTGRFALFGLGGSYKVTNWTVTVQSNKNIQDLFIGDSITHGYCATTLASRWVKSVQNTLNRTYEVSSGAGDGTQRVLDKMTAILAYNASRVFLMLGTNDISNAVADATIKANYSSIVSQLEADGITVVLVYNIPRNGVSIAAFNTWISSTFAGRRIIDIYTPLASGANLAVAYNAGDNIHPNDAGHALIASTILSNL